MITRNGLIHTVTERGHGVSPWAHISSPQKKFPEAAWLLSRMKPTGFLETIATLKAWQSEKFCRDRLGRNEPMGPIDLSRLNVKGGSIAMGHPFAATGARIMGTLAKVLGEKGSGRGLISVCTAGGMGISAIMEAA